MKVLVADKLHAVAVDGLKALGCELDIQPDLNEETLAGAIEGKGHDVLIVRSTKVNRAAIEASSLSLIIRAGAGYNTIDVTAASEKGIYVANCPGKNSIAVAELAFGLMLSLDRFIPQCVAELKEGHWNKKAYSKGNGLYGATLGLVGMGQIAQEMIPRAKAFGMNVIAFSRWMSPEIAAALGIGRAESLEDLAKQSDVVSVHVAMSAQTKGMIDASFFSNMKDGASFINTSRAEVVDEDALIAAVKSGKVRAGLDVMANEPSAGECDFTTPLADLDGVVCTHHIGASTEQAQTAVAEETVRIIAVYKSTGTVPNVVNITKGAAATHLLVVRHMDKVGVLATVFESLKAEGISVQEMENIILGGAQSAIAQISLDKELSQSALDNLKMHPDIFDALQVPVTKD